MSNELVSGHVVRTQRIELVDEGDRVWCVLGELTESPSDSALRSPRRGIALIDPKNENMRMWAVLDEDNGPHLGLDLGGNNAVTLGVHEGADAFSEFTYLWLAASDGTPILNIEIAADGEINLRDPQGALRRAVSSPGDPDDGG